MEITAKSDFHIMVSVCTLGMNLNSYMAWFQILCQKIQGVKVYNYCMYISHPIKNGDKVSVSYLFGLCLYVRLSKNIQIGGLWEIWESHFHSSVMSLQSIHTFVNVAWHCTDTRLLSPTDNRSSEGMYESAISLCILHTCHPQIFLFSRQCSCGIHWNQDFLADWPRCFTTHPVQ